MSEENKKDEGPGLYQLFLKDKITPEGLEDHFETLTSLPYGSSLMIWLNSPGGSPQSGFMLDDKLTAKNINVTYISYLFNASAACTLPQLSDAIRLSYPHSVFTFHGASIHVGNRKDQFDMIVGYAADSIDRTNDRCMAKVGLSKKDFKKFNGDDIIFYGYQLLDVGEHGWIDGLILKEHGAGKFLIKTRDGNKIIDVSKHKRSDIKDLPVVE